MPVQPAGGGHKNKRALIKNAFFSLSYESVRNFAGSQEDGVGEAIRNHLKQAPGRSGGGRLQKEDDT